MTPNSVRTTEGLAFFVLGKVLARSLYNMFRRKLLTHQRQEQSGVTPFAVPVRCILALRVLSVSACVTSALGYRIRYTRENSSFVRSTSKSCQSDGCLYVVTENSVRCCGTISDCFPVDTGVRQRCAPSPTVILTMYWAPRLKTNVV